MPTTPTTSPTGRPTTFSTPCGDRTFCYHQHIEPTQSESRFGPFIVQSYNRSFYNAEMTFDVFIQPYEADCVSPTIDVYFERIDNKYSNDQIMINGFYDGIQTVGAPYSWYPGFTACGGEYPYVDDECGVMKPCLNGTSLGVNRIKLHENYKLEFIQETGIYLTCPDDPNRYVNLEFYISCKGTAPPTTSPTKEPTQEPTLTTIPPTPLPSASPTVPTVSPTMAPTHYIEECGNGTSTNFGWWWWFPTSGLDWKRWCVYAEIEPDATGETSFDIVIQQDDIGADVYFDIFITSIGNDCIHPDITIVYEAIDYDSAFFEYFNVTGPDGKLITQCAGVYSCGNFYGCLYKHPLGNKQRIAAGTTTQWELSNLHLLIHYVLTIIWLLMLLSPLDVIMMIQLYRQYHQHQNLQYLLLKQQWLHLLIQRLNHHNLPWIQHLHQLMVTYRVDHILMNFVFMLIFIHH